MSGSHLDRIRRSDAAARVIGRRNALCHLAPGVGSALVAACSGGGTGGDEPDVGCSGDTLTIVHTPGGRPTTRVRDRV